jgi:aryl-alcohol dehydrogenase-like predicted oxidoreductase
MEQRPLGRTGVSVSKLCLGAMMFGDRPPPLRPAAPAEEG